MNNIEVSCDFKNRMNCSYSKILFFCISLLLFVPNKVEGQLNVFENLVGGEWKIEQRFETGQVFKQTVTFEWSLSKLLLKTKTFGYVDKEQREFGLRNEGIRALENGVIRFWEFDIFGGITEGICTVNGRNITYKYHYMIGEKRHDMEEVWYFVDKNTYDYRIISVNNGERKIILSGQFIREKQ